MKTISNEEIATDVSKILLRLNAVTFNLKKPYRFASGILSPMYTDNRLIISYPKEWQKIIGYLGKMVRKEIGLKNISVLSGTATAGIPHCAALAIALNKPMIYVRSSKKEYGKENLIEGTFKKNATVLIVEDLISTGKSSAQNIRAVKELGGKVEYCIAITTSTKNAYEETFNTMQVKLHTLTNAFTTVAVAVKKKIITTKEQQMILDFFEDSRGWGKRMGFE